VKTFKKKKSSIRVWVLVTIVLFLLLFSYLSLNLKSVDFGYEMQELRQYEKLLKDEINKLKARKASLLSLERVEDIVIHRLGYQYPEPEQLIKVVRNNHEDKHQ